MMCAAPGRTSGVTTEEGRVDPNEDSKDRLGEALAAAARANGKKAAPQRMISLLSEHPVFWELTAQQMAFVPRSGKYNAVYWNTDAAVAETFKGE